jgi:hypothetical protein
MAYLVLFYELSQLKQIKFIDPHKERATFRKFIIMLSNSVLQRLASWCPWLLRDEPKLKQPVKVLVTGAAGMRFRTRRLKQSNNRSNLQA